MSYFWKTDIPAFDVKPIHSEILRMWDTFSVGDQDRFALVHRSETDQDPHRDARSKLAWPVGSRMSDFRHFNTAFLGGPVHQFYETLRSFDPTVARLRVLRIRPYRCYSLHNDEEIRYHLVVTTNPSCLFVVNDQPRNANNRPVFPAGDFEIPSMHTFRLPQDGCVYALDANHVHTAINAGGFDRIHIVVETVTALNDRPIHVQG